MSNFVTRVNKNGTVEAVNIDLIERVHFEEELDNRAWLKFTFNNDRIHPWFFDDSQEAIETFVKITSYVPVISE